MQNAVADVVVDVAPQSSDALRDSQAVPLDAVSNAIGGGRSADIVAVPMPQSDDAPAIAPPVPDGEILPPWDIRRWPNIPVPQDQRIVPTITTEGPDIFRNFVVTEVFDASGKHQEGTIFKIDGVLKVWDDGKTHSCDEVGNYVTKKAVIRPPSHTPESWSQVPGHRPKHAWIKFWDGEEKAVDQTPAGPPGQSANGPQVAGSAGSAGAASDRQTAPSTSTSVHTVPSRTSCDSDAMTTPNSDLVCDDQKRSSSAQFAWLG